MAKKRYTGWETEGTIPCRKKKKGWKIVYGTLRPGRGRTSKTNTSLFKFVAEKIPYEFLDDVKKYAKGKWGKGRKKKVRGIYVALDSMAYSRYIGMGEDIFYRLKDIRKKHRDELCFFSFYGVGTDVHKRELETLLIHVGGPLVVFNERKRKLGNVYQFEANTPMIRLKGGKS